jgi:uncharacterized integral membrane protein
MFKPRVVLAIVLGLLVLILVFQNTEVVTVAFLLWKFEMSRVILILLAVMTGFISGYLVARLTSPHSQDSFSAG